MKKIFYLSILLIIICMPLGVNVNASSNISSSYLSNCEKSLQNYEKAIKQFEVTNISLLNNDNISYDSNYCGSYIDENGLLKIGVKQLNDYLDIENIDYVIQDYSYNELLSIKEDIILVAKKYNVMSLYIDEELNKLIIELRNNLQEDLLREYLEGNNLSDDSYYIKTTDFFRYDSKKAYPGQEIDRGEGDDGGGTICVNAYDNETGEYGVVTNAHVTSEYGKKFDMYYGGSTSSLYKLGKSSKEIRGGQVDASFVPFPNNTWEQTYIANCEGESFNNIKLGSESMIVQGAPVVKFGLSTGITEGVILSNNIEIFDEDGNIVFYDVIRYTNDSHGGDSGGPVYFEDSNDNLYLIGMHFGTQVFTENVEEYGQACSIFNVFELLNITPVLNGTIYETTNLSNNEIRIDNVIPILPKAFNEDYTVHEIPSEINGRVVSSIGDNAFANQVNVDKFVIPSSVTNIGSYVFEGCDNLKELIIQCDDFVPTIGNNVFLDCDNIERIIVPSDKLSKYVNSQYWYSYKDLIEFNGIYDEVYVDCKNSDNLITNIDAGCDIINKFTIGCNNTYRITVSSENKIYVSLYNSYKNEITCNMNYVNNGKTVIIDSYLAKGTYYLDSYFESEFTSGEININCTISNVVDAYPALYSDNNVLIHLHENSIGKYESLLKFQNYDKDYMYKFTLSGTDLNGNDVIFPDGCLKLYDDVLKQNVLKKYNMIDDSSVSLNHGSSLLTFLSFDLSSIYISIILDTNEYATLNLKIEKIENYEYDLIYNLLNDEYFSLEYDVVDCEDNFRKITFNQISKIYIKTDNLSKGNLIVMQEYSTIDNEKTYEIIYNVAMSLDFYKTIILDEGVYYIGYINGNISSDVSFSIHTVINDLDYNGLYQSGGSEIMINGNMNNNNIITEGFTRILYLSNGDSRLDYRWYSSDESIVRVTDYGTVIGLNVNQDISVTVFAINITNPNIIYAKDYVIKKDTKTFNIDPLIYNLEINLNYGTTNFSIDLSSLDLPINWLQYYKWVVDSSYINVDQFGRVILNENIEKGEYNISGLYKLNDRVRIYIVLVIE